MERNIFAHYFYGEASVGGGRTGQSRNGHSASEDVTDGVDETGFSSSNMSKHEDSKMLNVFNFRFVLLHILKFLLLLSENIKWIYEYNG